MKNQHLQIKFCGLSRKQDIDSAVKLGVDALGFVFYPNSPRYVSPEQAKVLIKSVPAFVSVVALVVNATAEDIANIVNCVSVDVIQFHGDETPIQCQQLANSVNKRWIKALRVNAEEHTQYDIKKLIQEYHQAGASAVLLDAYHKDKYGGTGERFDWSLIPEHTETPIILAGGLTPDNLVAVKDIIGRLQALDVSGGIEASKGIKDEQKMQQFINNASSFFH